MYVCMYLKIIIGKNNTSRVYNNNNNQDTKVKITELNILNRNEQQLAS